MSILRPRTSTEMNYDMKPRWKPWDDRCGICGDYDGFHFRCWRAWLTEERVIRGYHDGEQQIEPDEDYPSRLYIAVVTVRSWVDPRYWYWRATGMLPWPRWFYRVRNRVRAGRT